MTQSLRVYFRVWPQIKTFYDGKKIYDFLKAYGSIEHFHIRREADTTKYQRIGFVQYKDYEESKHLILEDSYMIGPMTVKVELSDPTTNIYGDASAYLLPLNNMQRAWAWKGFYTSDSTFLGDIKQMSIVEYLKRHPVVQGQVRSIDTDREE
ncbi:11457_t:CDS:2 [Paraglomus brasilianum]|uniref:11457_t:CDS:1 n=1 Tax=Paraglomus brasilianum TaxID=144538 RepID=A0A9N9BZM1_9GLOM|nr:11457_t:CDS:2 [Paraglomus brasilianum]